MKYRKSMLSAAITVCLGVSAHAHAQDATTPSNTGDEATELGTVVVTGIRGAIQSSIERKREETVVADVLSSEDIGDLPALSIGAVPVGVDVFESHREISAAAADAKKNAKRSAGSCLFVERRQLQVPA